MLAMAVNERFEIMNRGAKDMEVDALADEKALETEESWATKEWLEWTQEEEQLDYMVKGKGGKKCRVKGKRLADARDTVERKRRRQRRRRKQRRRQRRQRHQRRQGQR